MRKSTTGNRNSLLPLRVKNDNGSTGTTHTISKIPRTSTGGRSSTGSRSSTGGSTNRRSTESSSYRSNRLSSGRSSVAAGRKSQGPVSGRNYNTGSMAPPAFKFRRSSGSNAPRLGYGQSHVVKDPRPNSEKTYKDQSIREIVEFLLERHYPYPITVKKLHTPLTNDFFKIFEFLYRYVDPNYSLSAKPEEDVPRIFSTLGYPFQISKSNMFTIGTPHTWPTLVAALKWLMELVQYAMNLDVEQVLFPQDQDDFDTIPESQVVFRYVEASYSQFMAGADTFEELEEELSKHLKQSSLSIGGGMEQLESNNARLSKELDNLNLEHDKLSELKGQFQVAQHDKQTFTSYLQELALHKQQQEKVLADLQEESSTLELEYQQITEKNKAMQHIFQTQEFSQADVERINMKRLQLKSQIDGVTKEVEAIDKQIWQEEMQIGKSQERTEEKCREYNKMAQILKLIPSTAENAQGRDYEMRPNYLGMAGSNDFIGSIKPALMEMKKQFNEKVHEMEAKKITVMEAYDQITEMANDKLETTSMLESKLKRVEDELDCKKNVMQQDFQKLQQDMDNLQSEITSMRQASQLGMSAMLQEQLQTAEKRCNQLKEEMNRKEQDYAHFLNKGLTLVMDHKIKIENHLKSMKDQAEVQLKTVQSQST